MRRADTLRLAASLVLTRWVLRFRNRAAFEHWQQRKVQCFLDEHLPRSPFYRRFAGQPLSSLPIVDKEAMLAHFDGMNTAGSSWTKRRRPRWLRKRRAISRLSCAA